MPLRKGKKNIGPNIETEMAHGKSYEQARAIALETVYGKKKSKARRPKRRRKHVKSSSV